MFYHYRGGTTRIVADFYVKVIGETANNITFKIVKVVSHPNTLVATVGTMFVEPRAELRGNVCWTPCSNPNDPNDILKEIL